MSLHRRIIAGALAVGCSFTLAQPASAHVEPDVETVPAGGSVVVAFTIEHGCEGSPTTKLEFKLPRGVSGVVPVEKEGWKTSVIEGVVTFDGGPLPDDQEEPFAIGFTAPTTVGQTIRFPLIQTCEQGQLDWVELDEQDERPAPALTVTKADPTATTTTLAGSPITTAPPTSTTAVSGTSTTIATGVVSDSSQEQDDPLTSGAPLIIAGVIVMTAGGVYGAAAMRRHKTRAE